MERWKDGRVKGVFRSVAKEAAIRALGSGFAVRRKLKAISAANAVTVLNLHRVAPNDNSAYRPLNPNLFEVLIEFLQQHCAITTFSELVAEHGSSKPKVILSFDDGYRDFYDVAMPILARRGVRVNHNIIPSCVETGLPPLNVLVQDFIGRAPAGLIAEFRVPDFVIGRVGSRGELGTRLSHFLKNKPITEQRALAGKLREQMLRDPEFSATQMMTLDQVREVAEKHEIGAHSFEHANMAIEDDEYLKDDLDRCRQWFTTKLGQQMKIYAFPNGSYRPGHLEMLRGAGIEHILLVDEDFTSTSARVHKRFTFDGLSPSEVRFRATGAFRQPA